MQQSDKSCLASAGDANHTDDLPSRDTEGHVRQHLCAIGLVGKAHSIKADLPLQRASSSAIGSGPGLRCGIHDGRQSLDGHTQLLNFLPQTRQLDDRRIDTAGQHIEGDQAADRQVSVNHLHGAHAQQNHHQRLAGKIGQLVGPVAGVTRFE
ncbi:hypothetical protein FQZ97_1075950 [compost metagenome]